MFVKACHRTTVLLLERNAAQRERFKRMLESQGFEVVGSACSTNEAVHLATRLLPEVALLDFSVEPQSTGLRISAEIDTIEAARRIIKLCPSTRVIVMDAQPDPAYIAKSMKAGISGYILKPRAAESLPCAIRAVIEGAIVLGAGVSSSGASGWSGRRSPRGAVPQ